MILSHWGWVGQSSKCFVVGTQNWNRLCTSSLLTHAWSFMPIRQRKGGDLICPWHFIFGIRSCFVFTYSAGILVPSDILHAWFTPLLLILHILLPAHAFLHPACESISPVTTRICIYCYYFNLPALKIAICGTTMLQHGFIIMLIMLF